MSQPKFLHTNTMSVNLSVLTFTETVKVARAVRRFFYKSSNHTHIMDDNNKPLLVNYQKLTPRSKRILRKAFNNMENGVKRSQFYNLLQTDVEQLKGLLERLGLFAEAFGCEIKDLHKTN